MNFVKNLFSFKYYAAILTGATHFKPVLAALILALVLAIKPTIFIFKDAYPLVQNLENKVLTLIEEVYPEELEIKIKNGQVSTDVTEPYYITIRQETLETLFALKKSDQNTKSKVRLLSIDTKGKADEFEKYQSLALLTQTSIVYYKDSNINIYPLREVKDLTINKEAIISKIKEINKDNKIGKIITIGALLSPFLIVIGSLLSQLIMFLLLTLIVYLMVKINQLPTGSKNTFRYTSAISFMPAFLWNLISFVPFLAGNILVARSLLTVIILGLAYSGINYLKSHQGNN